jgi:predicted nucleic acid-binding Zn ribbon protein
VTTAFEPVPLHQSLDDVVRSLRGGSGSAGDARSMGSLFSRWTDAVGQAVADHARPVKLDGGKLLVEVDEPGWATQLRFLEREVIQRLRSIAGLEVSRFDIRVKPH